MLARTELRALAQWCRGHSMQWTAAADPCGRAAIVLEGARRRAWERVFLILVDDGFSLVTEQGETLVTASDLPAALDAICDGVTQAQLRAAPRATARRWGTQASPGFVF